MNSTDVNGIGTKLGNDGRQRDSQQDAGDAADGPQDWPMVRLRINPVGAVEDAIMTSDLSGMRTGLTIAGSDSSGGAGIQADLKTFAAFGVFGMTAITAVTAQNTLTVSRVLALPADMVTAQIEAVVADIPPQATKIGMLATAAIAEAVAAALSRHHLPNVGLDTVMVAKGGARLLDDAASPWSATCWRARRL